MIRRLLVRLLCAMALFFVLPAGAESPAFHETSLWPEDLSALTLSLAAESLPDFERLFSAPCEVFADEDTGRMLLHLPIETASALRDALTPVSISPQGQTVIFSHTQLGLIALTQSQLTLLCAAPDRGSEDPCGLLPEFSERLCRYRNYFDHLVWSPDGRYAVLIADNASRLSHFPLMLLDVERGEFFFAGSEWEGRSRNAAKVVSAAFSADSKSLYYILYAMELGSTCVLMRHDLTLHENAVCHILSERYSSQNHLWVIDSQRLALLQHDSVTSALTIFTDAPQRWRAESHPLSAPESWHAPLSLPSSPARNAAIPFQLVTPFMLLSAPHSGCALIPATSSGCSSGFSLLIRAEVGKDVSGLDTYWYLPRLDCASMERLSPDDPAGARILPELYGQEPRADEDCTVIYSALLSPDGRSALLYAGCGGEEAQLLVNLEDMSIRPAACAEGLQWAEVWAGDGRLLLHTTDGLKAYTLE